MTGQIKWSPLLSVENPFCTRRTKNAEKEKIYDEKLPKESEYIYTIVLGRLMEERNDTLSNLMSEIDRFGLRLPQRSHVVLDVPIQTFVRMALDSLLPQMCLKLPGSPPDCVEQSHA